MLASRSEPYRLDQPGIDTGELPALDHRASGNLEEVQDLTDKHIATIDQMLERKEQEVMEV